MKFACARSRPEPAELAAKGQGLAGVPGTEGVSAVSVFRSPLPLLSPARD